MPGAAVGGSCWLRWEVRGGFVVIEWSDAVTMNLTLGRLSTLLEHPTLCGKLVGHAQQRGLPSTRYLGHNLYAETMRDFERLCDEQTSAVPSAGDAAIAGDAPTAAAAPATAAAPAAAASAPATASEVDDMAVSVAERGFLAMWHARGCPSVMISFVTCETPTLRHELCHARYALDDAYRAAIEAAWRPLRALSSSPHPLILRRCTYSCTRIRLRDPS